LLRFARNDAPGTLALRGAEGDVEISASVNESVKFLSNSRLLSRTTIAMDGQCCLEWNIRSMLGSYDDYEGDALEAP